MKGFLETLIAWGPAGVFVFAVLDGVGVPSPGGLDWLLVFLAARMPDMAFGLAGLALLGSLIGGLMLYYISRRAGEAMLAKYRNRPRFVRFELWFQRYGLLTVFIPALIPIPMPLKFFVICAGVFAVPPMTFFLVMLAARIPRYFALAYLGAQLGRESLPWLKAHVWHMFGIAAVLFVLLYAMIRISDRRRQLSVSR
jgi:membrane protein DedA with SNARE-associated domain